MTPWESFAASIAVEEQQLHKWRSISLTYSQIFWEKLCFWSNRWRCFIKSLTVKLQTIGLNFPVVITKTYATLKKCTSSHRKNYIANYKILDIKICFASDFTGKKLVFTYN